MTSRYAWMLWLTMFHASASDPVSDCRIHFDKAHYLVAHGACVQAANSGDAVSQTLLGEMYDQGLGVKPSAVLARQWWQAAASRSYLPAQNLLALKYYYGGEVFQRQPDWPQDYARAFELWRQGAVKGAESSQFMLGQMYMLGQGVERDYAEAYAWFQMALSGGYKLATDSLVELSRLISAEQMQAGRLRLEQLQGGLAQ